MAYRLVVFDWDGTLMDSTQGIVAAIQGACQDLELPIPTAAQASWVIGLSLEGALRRAVPQLAPAMVPRFQERFRVHLMTRDPELRLFDGAESLLADLAERNVRLAVATGKSRAGLNRVLAATGLHRYFDATRTADETFGKPHPAMLNELMDELDVDAAQTLMVGDTSHDMQMACNASVHGLGVSYGAHPAQNLLDCSPQAVVNDVPALREWLMART